MSASESNSNKYSPKSQCDKPTFQSEPFFFQALKKCAGKFAFSTSIDGSALLSVIALFTVCSFPVDQIECVMYSPNLTQ